MCLYISLNVNIDNLGNMGRIGGKDGIGKIG